MQDISDTYEDMLIKYGLGKYKGEELVFSFEEMTVERGRFKGKIFRTKDGTCYTRTNINEQIKIREEIPSLGPNTYWIELFNTQKKLILGLKAKRIKK